MTIKKSAGTITFQNMPQLALWLHMLTGQMSDGMWENTRPHDHWKFWGQLETEIGKDLRVTTDRPWECKKVGYDFNALIDVVGDEMLALGRMAQIAGVTQGMLYAARYMPGSLEKFNEMRAKDSWPEYAKTYISVVSDHDAEMYYAASYSGSDLRRDLRVIKAVMKTVKG
jgi:hypothetical protein